MSEFQGKGSWQRPVKDQKKFDSEYDRIFGSKKAKKSKEKKDGK